MKIGIDIDGVLTNYTEFIMDYATKYFYENKIDYKICPTKYDEEETFNLPYEGCIENFWNEYLGEYAQNYPARKFAAEVITKLKQENEIYIITARNEEGLPKELYGKMQTMVKKWLKDNNIEYDKIIFSGSKLEICKQENINIMIEDKPSTIIEMAKHIPVLCFDAPYNKDVAGKNITRVYSWYDILKNINKI